ncbi:MAG: alkaline phosphatase family protein, partial [Pyrinomonadaceae bacterium]
CAASGAGQNVKRVVILKIDGLPAYYVDRFVKQKDLATGKSVLPWFDEVFYKNGTRVPNFYTRGMSLSGPAWGQLDTGQHLQIKGNVEYDRFTLHTYDYLNFIPYYLKYGLNSKADMPAVEVLDQLKIPLLSDAFDYENRYTSQQLYQRGTNWEVLASGFVNLYPGNPKDFIDEWILGLEYRAVTISQAERDIIGKLAKRDHIDYFDYFDVSFDHVSHNNNDTRSRLADLKKVDAVLGRFCVAIQGSARAAETALILISDHGFNSDEKVYSQGFNLVKMLTGSAGGGHHVITKRRLMLDYSIKGIYPLIPLIKTTSENSKYLKGQSSDYPTALLDFDGNERSSIHLRNSDLNLIHILLQQLQNGKIIPAVKNAAIDAIFDVIERNRPEWRRAAAEMTDELDALARWIVLNKKVVDALPKKLAMDERAPGADKEARRISALHAIAVETETDYRKYLTTLQNLIALSRETFRARDIKIADLVAPGAMGDSNSVFQLQNYIVGLSPEGLVVDENKDLDLARSFTKVNYLDLLHDQRVRNNVQKGVSNRPVDFVALRLPLESVKNNLKGEVSLTENPIWLFGGPDKQALILTDTSGSGDRRYRYLPIAGLRGDVNGQVEFDIKDWDAGFPLKYFEDDEFAVPRATRAAWLSDWHTEIEWLTAVHKTAYSNGIIGLNEQMDRHPVFDADDNGISPDDQLIRRFRQRQRQLTEADLLILANNHWNFDVRGFNPGGNHGSFFRVSTNSTFMIAGGANTGIPRGLAVEQPYDSLSFVPTVLRLMGKIDAENNPAPELAKRGFKRFPGRLITEITSTRR